MNDNGQREFPFGADEKTAERCGRSNKVRGSVRGDGLPDACDLYDITDLSREDVVSIRMLVNDRIEERFRYAVKVASEMSVKGLAAVTQEILRLDGLRQRLDGDL